MEHVEIENIKPQTLILKLTWVLKGSTWDISLDLNLCIGNISREDASRLFHAYESGSRRTDKYINDIFLNSKTFNIKSKKINLKNYFLIYTLIYVLFILNKLHVPS